MEFFEASGLVVDSYDVAGMAVVVHKAGGLVIGNYDFGQKNHDSPSKFSQQFRLCDNRSFLARLVVDSYDVAERLRLSVKLVGSS